MQKIIRRFGFVAYGSIMLLLVIAAVAYIVLSPRSKDVLVTVRLAEKDLIWTDQGSPRILVAGAIQPGMQEKDAFGRVVARVTRVVAFDQPTSESVFADKKMVYVTVRLRALHNARRNTYRYQGTMLQVGGWVRFTIQSTIINGLVVSVPAAERGKAVRATVKAQLKTEGWHSNQPFGETTGVDRFVADAIAVGDKATDSEGNVIAEITEKRVEPATRITGDLYGNVFLKRDPRKYDVYLTVRVAAREVSNELYYLDILRLKVNSSLPLFLSRIDILPNVTEIVSLDEQ